MRSKWPDFTDGDRTREERDVLRDEALRMVIDKVDHAADFSQEEREVLKTLINAYRVSSGLRRFFMSAAPLVAAAAALITFWSDIMTALRKWLIGV